MKIVAIGTRYTIYGEDIYTCDQLPAQYYQVSFNKMEGFSLVKRPAISVQEEKVYGQHEAKADKILRSFSMVDKNLGVILSGSKGIGKSLFAKLLSEKMIEAGIPVIIVDSYIPGIANFLESIEQEAVVIFDEFEKTFVKRNDYDPQVEMLTLFDGMSNGKKLFVITCNSYTNLNDFLINRPGRFHYHIRFDYPSTEEVEEYLYDKLDPKYYDQIRPVQQFADRIGLNYDCLRAIAFELNTGIPFSEAIKDLNIINIDRKRYDVRVVYPNGWEFSCSPVWDPYGTECYTDWMIEDHRKTGTVDIQATVNMMNAQYDYEKKVYVVPGDKIQIRVDYDSDIEEEVKIGKELEKTRPLYMICSKAPEPTVHYLV